MEGQENDIVQAPDETVGDDEYSSDSDDDLERESYRHGVRYHSDCSKRELKRLLKSTDPNDQKVLGEIVTSILSQRDEESFQYLYFKGCKINSVDEKGQTMYHRAYYHNAISIIDMLYTWEYDKSDYVNSVDVNGLSCLHIASFAGDEAAINYFLKTNVNVNAHCQLGNVDGDYSDTDRDGFTPLHFAILFYRAEKIIRLLLENGADVSAVDSSNRTPLHVACRSYESPGYLDDSFGNFNSLQAMNVLVEYKSDISARDKDGNTPLLSVIPDDFGAFETTRLIGFIESIPLIEIKQKLKFLLEKGADVTVSNNNGDNILHLIVKNLEYWRCTPTFCPPTYSEFSFDIDEDHRDMIKLILELDSQLDVNARNNEGKTPLQLAVSLVSSTVVKVLLENGADLSDIQFDHKNPKCFKYPSMLPDLDAVQNTINMVELLVNNDWDLTLESNLAILKFLVHDVDDCKCSNLPDVFHLGSIKHMSHVLSKKLDALPGNSELERNRIAVDFQDFFLARATIGMNYKELLSQTFQSAAHRISVDFTFDENSLLGLVRERFRMDLESLQDNLTLRNLMVRHPNDINYYQIRNHDFRSIAKSYPITENAIKGHITKVYVRHYVEDSAYAYLKGLPSLAFLPYTCCKRVLYYCSNEDIFNLCLAAILDNS